MFFAMSRLFGLYSNNWKPTVRLCIDQLDRATGIWDTQVMLHVVIYERYSTAQTAIDGEFIVKLVCRAAEILMPWVILQSQIIIWIILWILCNFLFCTSALESLFYVIKSTLVYIFVTSIFVKKKVT